MTAGRPGWRRITGLLALTGVAAGLIAYSHNEPSGLAGMRETVASFAAPVLVFIQAPLEPLKSVGRQVAFLQEGEAELRRLRGEIQELSGWKWRAKDLERRLKDLEGLARVVDAPGLAFITSEVLAVSPGVLDRNVLLNGGSNQGVRSGFPVLGADGLVGIVTGVGPRSARVRLIEDAQSRIGVSIGPDRVVGDVIGRGRATPEILLPAGSPPVASGDEIITSGRGGLLPKGLRVGRVVRVPGGLAADLYAQFERLDYVSVLFHESSDLQSLLQSAPAAVSPAAVVQGALQGSAPPMAKSAPTSIEAAAREDVTAERYQGRPTGLRQ